MLLGNPNQMGPPPSMERSATHAKAAPTPSVQCSSCFVCACLLLCPVRDLPSHLLERKFGITRPEDSLVPTTFIFSMIAIGIQFAIRRYFPLPGLVNAPFYTFPLEEKAAMKFRLSGS